MYDKSTIFQNVSLTHFNRTSTSVQISRELVDYRNDTNITERGFFFAFRNRLNIFYCANGSGVTVI